ncbi:MAG TPA: hypothetical protein VJN64_00295 [Terriglobales bacterium]|nr:hypothetical protein [Terriglobales bacterium]
MAIEFRGRVSDLKNATKQLLVNRGEFRDSDLADLLVSECAATLRSVGTSTEIPVFGTSPGVARLPLSVLKDIAKIAGTYKSKEVPVVVEEGSIKVSSFRMRSEEITLGSIPNQQIDIPVDASLLDTLALGVLLNELQITEQGLTRRVLDAWQKANEAIHEAASSLRDLDVTEAQIRGLVEERVKEAAERLRGGFVKNV